MNMTPAEINHATAFDLSIAGTPVLNFDATGIELVSGKNKNWFVHLLGKNFAVGGAGAVADAVTSIGSFRKYNAFEFPNGATDPYFDVNFWLPPDYDASELAVTLFMFKTATATGTNIVTNFRLACIGAADTLDATMSSTVNVTTAVGANSALFTVAHTVTPANAADGGLCHGIVQRVPTNVSDDYTGSVYMIGALVKYS